MEREVGGSVYNFVEVVGTSTKGWEEAVGHAVETAAAELTNLRIAEVKEMDVLLGEGNVIEYRAKVRLSFKHEIEPETL
jgi:flavin-binding protein dodecin